MSDDPSRPSESSAGDPVSAATSPRTRDRVLSGGEQVDEVVRQLSQRIDRLEHELRSLRRELEALEGGADADS